MPDPRETIDHIAAIIRNQCLAGDVFDSIEPALRFPSVHLSDSTEAWDVFQRSLNAAIRDIESHPRGKLFKRLIEYGPADPDSPKVMTSDDDTILSDDECGSCVEFIFSHMVNRFKGEIAELLALKPCINLVQSLILYGRLPENSQIYWGETIQERRGNFFQSNSDSWGSFTKGADGLVVGFTRDNADADSLAVQGIVEIKSMRRSPNTVLRQIDHHAARLKGGLKLAGEVYPGEIISIPANGFMKILVMPSSWKLSREFHFEENPDGSRSLLLPERLAPPIETETKELQPNSWIIYLSWSQEAINEAAYEMTFWYMSQVGKNVYEQKPLPKGWEGMTAEEVGYNSIKMMLYYMLCRYLSPRQQRMATRLYNVYCFGYPLGVDNKEMMWPEDLDQM